ncbi:hypothetical protein V2154_13350 [Ewingella sp. CoE-038-23]|uniref:hypothetical protein n=1 Tax=Ewingella docleensis TaxID=3118588 RepID=UPI0033658042
MMGKNRETFEAAFKGWHPGKTGPYIKHIAEYFWNQSRQAIEVELNGDACHSDDYFKDGYRIATEAAEEAITSLGIRVKGNEE